MTQDRVDIQNRDWVSALIETHLPDIFTLCNRMASNRHDAEDMTQQAVLRILRSLPQYRSEAPLRHWLLRVSTHAALDYLRAKRRTQALENSTMPPAANRNESGSTAEDEAALRDQVERLSEDLKLPVILYYFHKMTQADIASVLDISQPAVKGRLDKALDALKQGLTASGFAGMVPLNTLLANAGLDAVPATVQGSVQSMIATEFATGALSASAGAGSIGGAAGLQTIATTGGIFMKLQLAIAAGVIGAVGFFSGMTAQSLSSPSADNSLLGETSAAAANTPDSDASRLNRETAAVEQKLAATTEELQALRSQVEMLQTDLSGRDAEITRLRENLAAVHVREDAEDTQANTAAAPTLSPEKARELIAESLNTLVTLQNSQDQQELMKLGIQLVAQLGKLKADDFKNLAALDATLDDPDLATDISMVMLNAFVFNPKTTQDIRESYLDRHLTRLENHNGYGEDYYDGGLAQMTWKSEPYANAFRSIIEPMDDSMKQRVLQLALRDAARKDSFHAALGGVQALAGLQQPEATSALVSTVKERSDVKYLQRIAIMGLANRPATPEILAFLQQQLPIIEASEDPSLLSALNQSIVKVESGLKAQESK